MVDVTDVVDVLSPHRCQLGEGPWWSTAEKRLFWVDITGREVHRCSLDGAGLESWTMPSEVGFVVQDTTGGALVALRDGLYRLDLATGDIAGLVALEADRPAQRFNDGKCDPLGRVWFGSMHDGGTLPVGSLYRYDGQRVERVLGGVCTSNGLGWSADGRRMYYTDSPRRRIDVMDIDPASGVVLRRRVFTRDDADVMPDGLAVDARGYVWSAKWDGAAVVRYAPDGSVDRVLQMPVARPTSCMFAGEDLRTLVVTSAAGGPRWRTASPGLEGAVFLHRVETPGLPETPAPSSM